MVIKKLTSEAKIFRSEFKKQTLTALIAAIGLIIALSWQSFIKKLIDSLPKSGILLYHPYLSDLYTALVVTIIGATILIILSHWISKN